jgi:recombination protein RecT
MTNQITKPATDRTLKGLLGGDEFKRQVALALPKHLKPERFIRIAITALTRTPKLQECTQESFFQCLLDLSAMGLEPDGRRAHLIPFRNNRTNTTACTLIVDYKGISELVRRSGEVSNMHCDVVCENDEFDYLFGSGGFLKHKPALKNRGEVICAYSFVKLKDGAEDFDVMNLEEVEKVRSRSRSKDEGPWVDWWDEMAKKTVFRRHSKRLPLSPEVRDAIEKDDEPLTEEERFRSAKRARNTSVMLESPQPIVVPPSDEAWIPDGTIPANTPAHLSEQEKLFQFAESEGFTRLEFCQWARNEGHIKTIPEKFSDFPEDIAKRLNKAQTGLVNKLKEFKAEVAG